MVDPAPKGRSKIEKKPRAKSPPFSNWEGKDSGLQEFEFTVKINTHAPSHRALNDTARTLSKALYHTIGAKRFRIWIGGKEVLYDPKSPAGGSVRIED